MLDKLKTKEVLSKYTVLAVDDDVLAMSFIASAFARYFKEVYVAKDGLEGQEIYKLNSPDLIVTDVSMPVCDGIEMAKKIQELNPYAKIIFASAHNEESYMELLRQYSVSIVNKPINVEDLLNMAVELLSTNSA